MSNKDFDDDGFCVIGRVPSRWETFRERLSGWIDPHSRFFQRHMPTDPIARELVQLVFLNVGTMSEQDRRELLVDVRRRLGIRTFRKASLGYVGPEAEGDRDE